MEHYPVMLEESLEYLALRPEGLYADLTSGLGNHTVAIAQRLTTGRIFSLDRDRESLELGRARAKAANCEDRIVFEQSSFSELSATLRRLGVERLDGVLADLGVSRMQLTTADRGFSLQQDGPLDMRMSRDDEVTAADIVNGYSERDLVQLFMDLGEERGHHAGRIARALIAARPLYRTAELARVVAGVVPRFGKIHPATRVFQALRMAVNNECGELDSMLEQVPGWLAPEGRWVVIAFHSIDDRRVKNRFRDLAQQRQARILTKHVVRPGDEETRKNPASRSAVLRALERAIAE